ncbi:MAG: carboxypeptidase-like regulatory domain-containing protein [Acidobacteriota bacterium]|nr:carboxypeptidase-like regulatory domain-containing protein [Acidobacteriota bacterium]
MYLKMNIPRVTNAILFLNVLCIVAHPATAQQMGRVQITSLNARGETVPFIDVVVEGEQINRKLETVGIGDEYENSGLIELPVGVYRVTSRNENYYPFRRAAFRVEAGKILNINVFPPIRVLMQALIVDERGARDEYDLLNRLSMTLSIYQVRQNRSLTFSSGMRKSVRVKRLRSTQGVA